MSTILNKLILPLRCAPGMAPDVARREAQRIADQLQVIVKCRDLYVYPDEVPTIPDVIDANHQCTNCGQVNGLIEHQELFGWNK